MSWTKEKRNVLAHYLAHVNEGVVVDEETARQRSRPHPASVVIALMLVAVVIGAHYFGIR
jgi:hypothetical protein